MTEHQKKPVTERMRDWAASAQSVPIANRAEFLNARSDVESLLADNWSVRKIWGFLTAEGRINYGLSSFNRDVRRAIPKPGSLRSSAAVASALAANPSPSILPASAPVEVVPELPPAPRPKAGIGSTFRVTPTPNKRDLIGE